MQSIENGPPLPGDDNGGGGGSETNGPWGPPFDCGTNLCLLIGPLANHQAWLVLTNTHSPTYYQLLSRLRVNADPWESGQIVQDTGTTHQVRFNNAQTDYPSQRFFRGVGASTVASISLNPDYDLAVEPATNNGSGQMGKFRVSLTDAAPGAGLAVSYQISGSASNGVDYSSLSGSVTITQGTTFAEVEIHPLYDTLPEFDESVTLTLVLTNGYLVEPPKASATMKLYDPRPEGMAVAIHDSGWTKLNGLSSTNWNYFVMPESVKEALRSDGTPYVVVSDLDVANGFLLTTNGTPKYPILISLASEVNRDDEIGPLTNYVAAGGFLFVGSSSFTRYTDGSTRTDYAIGAQMGIHCTPAYGWSNNTTFSRQSDHRVVSDIPTGPLKWRMPTSAEEISWGTCMDGHGHDGPHQIWPVATSSTNVLATATNGLPYLAVKAYGNGHFVYHAGLRPLIGHGGHAPGAYAYVLFRRAIEWAFEAAGRPVARLSPWPFQYNSAFMVRHDLEHFRDRIAGIADSAYIEYTNGAWGDYYFCTGRITNAWNYAYIVGELQRAVTNYGTTIGPHNGGLVNPRIAPDTNSFGCQLDSEAYEYWHWGPDEALDLPGGYAYASNSLVISWAQIESWVGTNDTRLWVAPYFNATREDSCRMQEQLGVRITGDQKLSPLPSWTVSTQEDGKRYPFLSEPVSEWFVNGVVAQSLEKWPPGYCHDEASMRSAVDFYYGLGALVNLYSHTLATGLGEAEDLVLKYIQYCRDGQAHPNLWSANAKEVYAWWVGRGTAQITASYWTNGDNSVTRIEIAGAVDPDAAVEIVATGSGSPAVQEVRTNGQPATTNYYRTVGKVVKVRVGAVVTNVEIEYVMGPEAQDDFYRVEAGQALSVPTPGVLGNDTEVVWPGLIAASASSPGHGTLTLTNNGGFLYQPDPGFSGQDCFTYEAKEGTTSFGVARVRIVVTNAGVLFEDNFIRCPTPGTLAPWQSYSGQWSITNETLEGVRVGYAYGNCYGSGNWSNCSVEAQVKISAGACGGGIGARLNPGSGAHYAAWIYPEDSTCVSNVLMLVKFRTWDWWGYNGTQYAAVAQTGLASVGTGWHTLKMNLNTNYIEVYYDGNKLIATNDTDIVDTVLPGGGVSQDVYNGTVWADNVMVRDFP
jgi:hypothetical protein